MLDGKRSCRLNTALIIIMLPTVLGPTIVQVMVGVMLVVLVQKVFKELKDTPSNVRISKGEERKEKPGTIFRGKNVLKRSL